VVASARKVIMTVKMGMIVVDGAVGETGTGAVVTSGCERKRLGES
jgi:ABC-type proline/glycine betaine transport system permease subunit